jgi:glucokinase
MTMRKAIGLDLGGSKVAGGVVDGAGAVIERLGTTSSWADTPEQVIAGVVEIVTDVQQRHAVEGLGICVAGLVDWPEGRVRWSFTPGYNGVELRRLLTEATGLNVIVDNDANAAAWGETNGETDGEANGPSDYLAMFCVGSGLGSGFVLGGDVYRGATGIAAEVGHLPVNSAGTEACGCGCDLVGTLSTLASGFALARAAQRLAEADPDGLIARLGKGSHGVTGRTVTEAARLGDPAARELFARLGHWLGIGASVLVTLLDLNRIVVGGGLVAAADLYLDHMREAMRRNTFAAKHRRLPSITPARLGADAGWIGAGRLALHHLG